MTHDKKCAFHQDGPCNCWMSRVSPCGAETSETTTPEPEWLTSLRQDMRAAIGSTPITSRLDVIASVATGVAAAHLRPIYAELVNARDEYEGTETRRVELEADVRALGGDPDRMVDPREHEAAIAAMREEMLMAARMGAVNVVVAKSIAGEHMLRMAQGTVSVGAEGCGEKIAELEKAILEEIDTRDRYHDIADQLAYVIGGEEIGEHSSANDPWRNALAIAARRSTTPAPEVREVPAGEAREGDTVTDTRRGRIVRLPGDRNAMVRWDGNSGVQEVDLDWSRITVSRPVSPLPDQPGAVIRCRIKGLDGIRVAELESDGTWLAMGIDDAYWASDGIEVIEVLYLPAGAGVDEGGKP